MSTQVEAPCAKSPDKKHCQHWYDDPDAYCCYCGEGGIAEPAAPSTPVAPIEGREFLDTFFANHPDGDYRAFVFDDDQVEQILTAHYAACRSKERERCAKIADACADERRHLLETCWPASREIVQAKLSEAERIAALIRQQEEK